LIIKYKKEYDKNYIKLYYKIKFNSRVLYFLFHRPMGIKDYNIYDLISESN